ncbi:MAG: dTDP-4-dehydrorhamnose reductase [Caldilineaceae bacterium]|nr:dTDP-4-dehydrorhamnose reductase [Caldilineaceae bacterium]
MHVLLVGAAGQLGKALIVSFQQRPADRLTCWARPQFDLTQPAIADQVAALAPDVVINAAAWTNVDGAEAQPNAAYATNALGPHYLALGCQRCGAALVHVSTNEVFSGLPGHFYREYDQPAPQSVYARSKVAGEVAVQQVLDRLFIVRTAWLFGPGGVNFPSKITAAADKYGQLRVVANEIGNPSYAPDVADAVVRLVNTTYYGTYHLVNHGYASRFDFAQTLLQANGRSHITLHPIAATEWPRPAPPPLHAVLINQTAAALGIELRPWQEAVLAYAHAEASR